MTLNDIKIVEFLKEKGFDENDKVSDLYAWELYKLIKIAMKEQIMTQEDKELLLSLLKQADEEGLLHIYDSNENFYNVDWLYCDSTINIKIKEF